MNAGLIQQLQVAGQVLAILLVYVFVWRVMRTARNDVAAPFAVRSGGRAGASAVPAPGEESKVLTPEEVARARRAAGLGEPRIVVLESPILRAGVPYVIGHAGLSLGRAVDNDIVLDDPVVSSRHARLVAPGVLEDCSSTNGTFVNGRRVDARTQLKPGDRIAIGATEFAFEVSS